MVEGLQRCERPSESGEESLVDLVVWTARPRCALAIGPAGPAPPAPAGEAADRLGHHSSLWPGLVSMLLLGPSMFFGLIAGGVADRRNRARMAAAGQLGNSIQGPAWQAIIPDLVGRERLLDASMSARIAQQGAELTVPQSGPRC